ncbi:disease resistance protein Pik-2-like [Miscanthus floridulus]|uniref:disease resistance protein Pik-2-like n=1 Tax=Miscanthus floridulus TaxID=154761 RepID=UPI0034582989
MSSFALGLTKTAVQGTLSLVKSTAEEEKKLREKVQNDLVFISGELEMMQSFLRAANNNSNNNDQVALTRVRQLRNLAFDVEDCVEYVVHLDLDDGKSSRWGWLRRLWYTVNCRAPPLPLDVAVADIKQLKARVEDVSQRNIRYNNLILHGSNNNN